ncbi:ABC transporter substrate-binding protein [Rheinheimera sp.]|uniref:substrate-binding periplasmic protein n=1 Tax=Rheinheimera sp. TaxID=1869214 RepID=UPI0027B92B6E|nr:transporter substrate-binding domain-containing protein [Rheinheimera sp.]
MFLRRLFFVCLILCGVCSTADAATPQPNRLTFFTEHFPPYSFVKNGEVRGINADILREACQLAKLECDMVSLPWLRAFAQAQLHNNAGLFPTVRTAKRARYFQWVGPLASSKAYLYRLKSRPEVNPKSLEDAKTFGIAVARGDVYEEYFLSLGFESGKNLLGFATKSDPIPLFLKGKVDLVVASELVMPTWLSTLKQPVDLAEPVLDISLIGNNFLALNNNMPPHTVRQLQQAIDQLKSSGRFRQIISRYHDKPELFFGQL